MPATYDSLSSTTLTGSQSSVTFSNISQNYTDLILIAMIQHTSNSGDQLRVGNGSVDTGSNYSSTFISAASNNANVVSGNMSGTSMDVAAKYYSAPTSTYYVPLMLHFMNYSNTSINKTVIARYGDVQENNGTAGTWASNSAINTIQLFPGSGISYTSGCTFTLYGIKAA